MTDVVIDRNSRENEVVISKLDTGCQGDGFNIPVYTDYFTEHEPDVSMPTESSADRLGDVGGGECGGRHLIQKRLDEIPSIDYEHVDVAATKRMCAGNIAKPASDDHPAFARIGPTRPSRCVAAD